MHRRSFLFACLAAGVLPASFAWASAPVALRSLSAPGKREIFLTIDDGYSCQAEVLDLAQHYSVPLSLFVTGQCIESTPSLWQRALDAGHTLGCHSYSHTLASRMSAAAFRDDLARYQKAVVRELGEAAFNNVKWFRFPYGDAGSHANHADLRHIIEDEFGWRLVGWDLDLSFAQKPFRAFNGTAAPLRLFEERHSDSAIVLLHFKRQDVGTLEAVIEAGLEEGVTFKKL